MSSPPSSPISPISKSKRPAVPHGFIATPKPKQKTPSQMTTRELHDRHYQNKQFLAAPGASTSTYITKILLEQKDIETQLAELEGVDNINAGMRNTRIKEDEEMDVDGPAEPHISRTIDTKRRILARHYGPQDGTTAVNTLSLDEAMEIEQRQHSFDVERRRRQQEQQQRLNDIQYGHMTQKEREDRIWAFMSHKGTDSDMEDEDEDGEDDPAGWFDDEDEQDKHQNIVEPDEDDYYNIIRVDASKVHYNTFYEPRDTD